MFPYGVDVTVYTETRDRYGDVTLDGERVVRGCALAPRMSAESDGAGGGQGSAVSGTRQATVVTGLTLYAPAESGITALHRIRLADGTVWRVQGMPAVWRSPFTGWAPGEQIELERVTG